ncbi:MAG: transposase [Lachnospiraceae bacterium]|nr:transposase [Lachnospiraceae bacterium]
MAILISAFSLGYHGKTIDFEKYSPCHRTNVSHFLNKGKWDDPKLEDILKSTVIQFIYKEAQLSGKPVFCIVDDTISSKTKPSSRALHPIEDAYFHQSHLKGKQDYGHQAVAVMLSCNGIVLNYTIVMYDKSKSKVKIVQEIADELPVPPVVSYFLDKYVERWPIEVFFRQSKDKLAFDRYQVRSSKGIRRYWLLMSLVHLVACTGCGEVMSFEDGYAYIYSHIQEERLRFIYQCGARQVLFY